MSNPTAAMLVIGDEILSGRTRDTNMYFLAGELAKVGIDLHEVRIVGDDREAIDRYRTWLLEQADAAYVPAAMRSAFLGRAFLEMNLAGTRKFLMDRAEARAPHA